MENFTPCDASGMCPYGEAVGMYWCREHCGLGVDENSNPQSEEEEE